VVEAERDMANMTIKNGASLQSFSGLAQFDTHEENTEN